MGMKDKIAAAAVDMTQEQYFEASEGRTVVTPENIGGLVDYPALFKAMQVDRELRPALSESQSTGRALNDFLSMSPEDFLEKYVVADGPVNPKTGKPFGTDTKAFVEWRAMQTKTPVPTAQFNMFGKMAQAYNSHAVIRTLGKHERMRNVVLGATIGATVCGVPCLCKIDSLYVSEGSTFGVDVKSTSDLQTFARAARGLYYPEQQALMWLVLEANGVKDPQVRIAALEKGPMPRCGVFAVAELMSEVDRVRGILDDYAKSCQTGAFGTRFEAPVLI